MKKIYNRNNNSNRDNRDRDRDRDIGLKYDNSHGGNSTLVAIRKCQQHDLAIMLNCPLVIRQEIELGKFVRENYGPKFPIDSLNERFTGMIIMAKDKNERRDENDYN
jgi:hypothetical protein